VIPKKAVGRYINQEDKGDIADIHDLYDVNMNSARDLVKPPTLETCGFQLRSNSTKVKNFSDD